MKELQAYPSRLVYPSGKNKKAKKTCQPDRLVEIRITGAGRLYPLSFSFSYLLCHLPAGMILCK